MKNTRPKLPRLPKGRRFLTKAERKYRWETRAMDNKKIWLWMPEFGGGYKWRHGAKGRNYKSWAHYCVPSSFPNPTRNAKSKK